MKLRLNKRPGGRSRDGAVSFKKHKNNSPAVNRAANKQKNLLTLSQLLSC